MDTKLNKEQLDILGHTMFRAAGCLYCGDSLDMQVLVGLGFMEPAGRVGFHPDPYFRITEAGRRAWNEHNQAGTEETLGLNTAFGPADPEGGISAVVGTDEEWTALPWETDDRVDMKGQAEQLMDDRGTDEEWTAFGPADPEGGISAVVGLAHPRNAAAILQAVNHHRQLVAACSKALSSLQCLCRRYMVGTDDPAYAAIGELEDVLEDVACKAVSSQARGKHHELVECLDYLLEQADADCPGELRSAHLREAIRDAEAMLVKYGARTVCGEEPAIDDSLKRCPDCERPNQFGELCPSCLRERQLADG